MIYNGKSLELFNNYIKDILSNSFINNYFVAMIVSYVINIISMYLLFHLIVMLYHHQVSKLKIFGAALTASIIYQSCIFISIQFFYVKVFSVIITKWLSIHPPYFIVILYFITVHILGINKNRCLKIIEHVYYLFISQIIVYAFYDSLFFYLFTQDRTYEYIIYITANIFTFVTILFCYYGFEKYIVKYKLWFTDYMTNTNQKIFSGIFYSLIKALVMYFFVTELLYNISYNLNFVGLVIILINITLLIIFINLWSFYYNTYIELKYKNESANSLIASQIRAISEFSGVKHDIANIMQVYHGYITLNDMDKLKKYHQSVYKLTVESSDRLTITSKLDQNPAFYSTLLYKLDKASKHGVIMSISCIADASNLDIHPIDLSRALGILLDNAIEEASETEKKFVYLYTEKKKNNTFLITISNSTKDSVNINQIFEENYTTKENHSGIGLYEFWQFATKSSACNLNVEYVNNTITFYIEIAYISKDIESYQPPGPYLGKS